MEEPNMRTIQGQQQALAQHLDTLVKALGLFCECFSLGEDGKLMWDNGDMNLMLSNVSKTTVETRFAMLAGSAKASVDLLNQLCKYDFNQRLARMVPHKAEKPKHEGVTGCAGRVIDPGTRPLSVPPVQWLRQRVDALEKSIEALLVREKVYMGKGEEQMKEFIKIDERLSQQNKRLSTQEDAMMVVLRAAKDFVESGVPLQYRNESFNYLKRSVTEAVKTGCYGYKAVLGVEVKPMGQAEGRQHRAQVEAGDKIHIEGMPGHGEVIASGDIESVQAYADAQNKKLGYEAYTVKAGKLWQATKQQLQEERDEAFKPENLLARITGLHEALKNHTARIEGQRKAQDTLATTVETLRKGFIDRCNELHGKLGNALTSIESILQQDRNTRSMFDQNKIERLAKLEEQVAQLIKGPTKPWKH